MNLVKLALIISITVFANSSAKANISIADLKTELQERPNVILQAEDYGDIDVRTRKQRKRDRKNRTNMSKKFGPIVMGVKLRNARRSNLNLKLDLMETFEIVNHSHNFRDLYTALKPDESHTILGPQLRSEIKEAMDLLIVRKDETRIQ